MSVRNVMYSDGTLIGGVGKGGILDRKAGVDAYCTDYYWNKSACGVCGELNASEDATQYNFTKKIYVLFDCDTSFTKHLLDIVRYKYAGGTYHTHNHGGSYFEFCFDTSSALKSAFWIAIRCGNECIKN